GGERTARVELCGGSEKDSGTFPIAPDHRNLPTSYRHEDAAIINDTPHPNAEIALYAERTSNAARNQAYFLQRANLDHTGKGNAGCLFDLHAGPLSLRAFNRTPSSTRTRGRATTARSLSLLRSKGKSPLAMELIADRYRNS